MALYNLNSGYHQTPFFSSSKYLLSTIARSVWPPLLFKFSLALDEDRVGCVYVATSFPKAL